MKFTVVAVGHKMPGWIDDGFAEYAGRMPRMARVGPLELIEVRLEPRRANRSAAQLALAEEARLLAAVPPGALKVALDESGREFTSVSFSRLVGHWIADQRDVALLVGGPDGLSTALKASCDMLLRLSSFTLPHGLARVVIAEQLYRAVSILANHPYHRE